jgi:2,3-bisphosphoglycerate-independent phosphoglycerate mutase
VSTYKRPLVLTILDGWGYRAETANNAIALAKKPTYDKLLAEFPNTLIQASDACQTGRWATAKSAI